MANLSQKLTRLRKEAGIKQNKLAKKIGCHSSTISRIERGQRLPTPAMLNKILEFYKHLFNWEEDKFNRISSGYHDELVKSSNRSFTISSTPSPVEDCNLSHEILDKYEEFEGRYFLYEYSSSGEDYFRVLEVEISIQGNKFLVQAEDAKFKYEGRLFLSELNIYVELVGVTHEERVLWVFHNPIYKKIGKLWGIEAAISVIHEPMARICLLSDTQLEESTIRKEFESYEYFPANSLMRIKKDQRLFIDNIDYDDRYPT